MKDENVLRADREEILRLRARVVVLEKVVAAALELALRIRPEELEQTIEMARRQLSMDYEDSEFASDLSAPAERAFVASEVERLMRSTQADLGFEGGVSAEENG